MQWILCLKDDSSKHINDWVQETLWSSQAPVQSMGSVRSCTGTLKTQHAVTFNSNTPASQDLSSSPNLSHLGPTCSRGHSASRHSRVRFCAFLHVLRALRFRHFPTARNGEKGQWHWWCIGYVPMTCARYMFDIYSQSMIYLAIRLCDLRGNNTWYIL